MQEAKTFPVVLTRTWASTATSTEQFCVTPGDVAKSIALYRTVRHGGFFVPRVALTLGDPDNQGLAPGTMENVVWMDFYVSLPHRRCAMARIHDNGHKKFFRRDGGGNDPGRTGTGSPIVEGMTLFFTLIDRRGVRVSHTLPLVHSFRGRVDKVVRGRKLPSGNFRFDDSVGLVRIQVESVVGATPAATIAQTTVEVIDDGGPSSATTATTHRR